MYYVIRNKEGKYFRYDSRFVHFNDLPNAEFYPSKASAEAAIKYYESNFYNALEYFYPLEICELGINWSVMGVSPWERQTN